MKKSSLVFTVALIPLDLFLIFCAFVLAYLVRIGLGVEAETASIVSLGEYIKFFFITAPLWVFVFSVSGLYAVKDVQAKPILDETKRIFLATSSGIAIIILSLFLRREFFFSRLVIFYIWVFSTLLVIFGRWFFYIIQRELFKFGIGVSRVIVLGSGRLAAEILETMKKIPGYKILGIICDDKACGEKVEGVEILGTPQDLGKIWKRFGRIDEIIQTKSFVAYDKVLDVISFCDDHRITYKFIPDILELAITRVEIGSLAGVPVLRFRPTPLEGWGRIGKRIMDILVSLIALIVLSPFFILIAAIQKLTSRGPIFYKHKRIGRSGKDFNLYKFRSMKLEYSIGSEYGGKEAEEKFKELMSDPNKKTEWEKDFKLKDDPRITAFGKFLRKTSIDELPQIFNVLKGDMSLVGPRPVVTEELEKYGPFKNKLLRLKPGVTGLWQVSGRSDTTYEERIKMDVSYIEQWSLWFDIKIILRTIWVVLTKKGVY